MNSNLVRGHDLRDRPLPGDADAPGPAVGVLDVERGPAAGAVLDVCCFDCHTSDVNHSGVVRRRHTEWTDGRLVFKRVLDVRVRLAQVRVTHWNMPVRHKAINSRVK